MRRIDKLIDETVSNVRPYLNRMVKEAGDHAEEDKKRLDEAYRSGYKRVILETTETWQEVIEFYKSFGFQITCFKDGDVYFSLDLHNHF